MKAIQIIICAIVVGVIAYLIAHRLRKAAPAVQPLPAATPTPAQVVSTPAPVPAQASTLPLELPVPTPTPTPAPVVVTEPVTTPAPSTAATTELTTTMETPVTPPSGASTTVIPPAPPPSLAALTRAPDGNVYARNLPAPYNTLPLMSFDGSDTADASVTDRYLYHHTTPWLPAEPYIISTRFGGTDAQFISTVSGVSHVWCINPQGVLFNGSF